MSPTPEVRTPLDQRAECLDIFVTTCPPRWPPPWASCTPPWDGVCSGNATIRHAEEAGIVTVDRNGGRYVHRIARVPLDQRGLAPVPAEDPTTPALPADTTKLADVLATQQATVELLAAMKADLATDRQGFLAAIRTLHDEVQGLRSDLNDGLVVNRQAMATDLASITDRLGTVEAGLADLKEAWN